MLLAHQSEATDWTEGRGQKNEGCIEPHLPHLFRVDESGRNALPSPVSEVIAGAFVFAVFVEMVGVLALVRFVEAWIRCLPRLFVLIEQVGFFFSPASDDQLSPSENNGRLIGERIGRGKDC